MNAHVVRIAHGVQPVVAPHTRAVVGDELAEAGVLTGGAKHPPDTVGSHRQAGGRDVVELDDVAVDDLEQPAARGPEPGDEKRRSGRRDRGAPALSRPCGPTGGAPAAPAW